jgi:O-antigen ligase
MQKDFNIMKISLTNSGQMAAIWLILFASFSINMRTAFMSISTGLLLICWLISGRFKDKFLIAKNNPAVIATFFLLFLYGVGIFYSSADFDYAQSFFFKYDKLLLIPIVATTLTNEKYRRYAINAFLISTIVVLIISYLKLLGIYPHHDVGQGYIVFKNRISGSIIMSFGMYWMLLRAVYTKGSHRFTWIGLSILAAGNVLFLVNGRTGMVLLPVLVLMFFYEIYGKRVLKYLMAIGIAGLLIAYNTPSLHQSRIFTIKDEISNSETRGEVTSAGQRVEFYKNTFKLISQHPIFGGGTGSMESEYSKISEAQRSLQKRVPNPHNQYLLTTQELGIFGLIALLAFWYIPWRMSYQLKSAENAKTLRGLIITITTGSLFNSLLLDASEGKFYCLMAGILLSAFIPNQASKNKTKLI